MLQIFLSAAFLGVLAAPLSAQDSPFQAKKAEPKVIETVAHSCEANGAAIAGFANLALKSNSRLFVIARRGTGETRARLNQRRLYNVRARLDYDRPLDPDRLILAEGENVKGQGRVEFYIGSDLFMVTTFRRNEDFCVDCCEWPDTRYYGRGKTN